MRVTRCLYCGHKGLSLVTHRLDDNNILRCGRCGVMMVEHLSDDTEALYTADYFEKSEGTKNGYTDYLSSPAANLAGKYAFSRLFARQPGHHLDLGCADGSLIEIFSSEGFKSRGLEISKDAVAIARSKGLTVDFSRLHSFPASLPKANVITAFDLLEHADKPGVVLKEVFNNLDKDGYFVFSTLSVKKNDPSDYWFNNSLEHYVYYNQESLAFILDEVFGADSFAFVEEEVNGIAEFWGVAKKGKLTAAERDIVKYVRAESFDATDAEAGYLMSLFYDQVSKFSVSEKIIDTFAEKWGPSRTVEARFFANYYQGKLEKALKDTNANRHLVSATRSIYWQAMAHAEEEFAQIRQRDIIKEYTDEVLTLRTDLFHTRDELHALQNSRVVGRLIKARNKVGDSITHVKPVIKSAPRRGIHKARRTAARVLPPPVSRAIMRGLRGAKRRWDDRSGRPIQYVTVNNEVWPKTKPLVSVVVPYYNRADTIDETLASLAAQTFRNFEVIIVDDGSTDPQSVTKAQALQKDRQYQVIHQQNQGVAAARNNGIAAAQGKYVICLDSDDVLDDTFIEKSVLVLETAPDVSLITTHQDMFGVIQELYQKSPYNPVHLYDDNMVITAAAFRKEAWEASGGYKPNIGYEDWEYWLTLAEHGFWGKLIPEPLFRYRTSMQSRYVEDKDVHWSNIKTIRSLHPKYKAKVRALEVARAGVKHLVSVDSAFVNVNDANGFRQQTNGNTNVLISIPWMTFGGAETLIYNFCSGIKDKYNFSFVTGLKSDHEWEYKFRKISLDIYHLANMFEDERLYIEFVSNYIETRKIDILHIIHNGFTFAMLSELRQRHPELKVVVTVFNDRAPYFAQSIEYEEYIDGFTTDNQAIGTKYTQGLKPGSFVTVIPNGIDCYDEFNPRLFDRQEERSKLSIDKDDLAVFFVGRLSEEKNPDVFLDAARNLIAKNKKGDIKFFVIGDGPMKPEIMKMLEAIRSKNVTYLGYQPTSEVARYLSAADVFVLPSSVEGFPLSILEAMAMKLAVVASDVGAISDVIESGRGGYVVTPGSAEEIEESIMLLRKDSRLLNDIKQHSRNEVEAKYSLRAFGGSYSKLYNTLYPRKPGRS